MEIRNKKDLIKRIRNLSVKILDEGILFRELANSIEREKDKRTLKEWKEFVKPFITRLEEILK